MLPANGYIEVKNIIGGGIGDDGLPVAASADYSAPIAARIQTLRHDKEGRYEDGRFIANSYHIFIPLDMNFTADEVRITLNGRCMGNFTVQNIEYLTLVNKVKITV